MDRNRKAAMADIARHIDDLCRTATPAPWRLVKGTSHDAAAGIVKRWGDTAIDVFLYLSEQTEPVPKSAIAKAIKRSVGAVDTAWSNTIAACAIEVFVGDSTEPTKQKIFGSGQGRMRGAAGVRLRLSKAQLPWVQLDGFHKSNAPIVAEAIEHLSGVDSQIEAHPERGAHVVAMPEKRGQLSLVKKTGTDAE